jgi:hypothetical protein
VSFTHRAHLRRNDFLTVGIGPHTPLGLLGRVLSVRANGSVIIGRANLQDVVLAARGSLAVRPHFTPHSAQVDLALDCSTGASARVRGRVTISALADLESRWDHRPGVRDQSLSASVAQRAALHASVTAAGSCAGSTELFARPLASTKTVRLGPVPVVVQTRLTASITAATATDAPLGLDSDQTIGESAQVSYLRGIGTTKEHHATHENGSTTRPSPTRNGRLGITVRGRLALTIDGEAGPTMLTTGGSQLVADVAAQPWWRSTGSAASTVNDTVRVLGFSRHASNPRETWTVGSAASPELIVSPKAAYTWSDTDCGGPPSFGPESVHVQGRTFPHSAGVNIIDNSSRSPIATLTSDADGSFDADVKVGLTDAGAEIWAEALDGAAEANADFTVLPASCVRATQSGSTVTLHWYGFGVQGNSTAQLLVNGAVLGSDVASLANVADSTTSFICPVSGTYSWAVDGTWGPGTSGALPGGQTLTC